MESYRPSRQDVSSGLLPLTALHPASRGAVSSSPHQPSRSRGRSRQGTRSSSLCSERSGGATSQRARPLQLGRDTSPEPSPRRGETEAMQEVADRSCNKVKLWTTEEIRGVRAECAKLRSNVTEVRDDLEELRTSFASSARLISQEQNARHELGMELVQKQHELRQWVAEEIAKAALSQTMSSIDGEGSLRSIEMSEAKMRSIINGETAETSALLARERADREDLNRQLVSLKRSLDQQLDELREKMTRLVTAETVSAPTERLLLPPQELERDLERLQDHLTSEREHRETSDAAMQARLETLQVSLEHEVGALTGRIAGLLEKVVDEGRLREAVSLETERLSMEMQGLQVASQLAQLHDRVAELEGRSDGRDVEGTQADESLVALSHAVDSLRTEMSSHSGGVSEENLRVLQHQLQDQCEKTREEVQRHCEEVVSECRMAVKSSVDGLKHVAAHHQDSGASSKIVELSRAIADLQVAQGQCRQDFAQQHATIEQELASVRRATEDSGASTKLLELSRAIADLQVAQGQCRQDFAQQHATIEQELASVRRATEDLSGSGQQMTTVDVEESVTAALLMAQRAIRVEETARMKECRDIRVQLEDVISHLRLDKAFNDFMVRSAEPLLSTASSVSTSRTGQVESSIGSGFDTSPKYEEEVSCAPVPVRCMHWEDKITRAATPRGLTTQSQPQLMLQIPRFLSG